MRLHRELAHNILSRRTHGAGAKPAISSQEQVAAALEEVGEPAIIFMRGTTCRFFLRQLARQLCA